MQGLAPSQSRWPLLLGRQQAPESSEQRRVVRPAGKQTVEGRREAGRVAGREEGGLGGADARGQPGGGVILRILRQEGPLVINQP